MTTVTVGRHDDSLRCRCVYDCDKRHLPQNGGDVKEKEVVALVRTGGRPQRGKRRRNRDAASSRKKRVGGRMGGLGGRKHPCAPAKGVSFPPETLQLLPELERLPQGFPVHVFDFRAQGDALCQAGNPDTRKAAGEHFPQKGGGIFRFDGRAEGQNEF